VADNNVSQLWEKTCFTCKYFKRTGGHAETPRCLYNFESFNMVYAPRKHRVPNTSKAFRECPTYDPITERFKYPRQYPEEIDSRDIIIGGEI